MWGLLRIIVEKITGRTCEKCKHNVLRVSCDNLSRYCTCVKGIYPREFEPKERGGAEK